MVLVHGPGRISVRHGAAARQDLRLHLPLHAVSRELPGPGRGAQRPAAQLGDGRRPRRRGDRRSRERHARGHARVRGKDGRRRGELVPPDRRPGGSVGPGPARLPPARVRRGRRPERPHRAQPELRAGRSRRSHPGLLRRPRRRRAREARPRSEDRARGGRGEPERRARRDRRGASRDHEPALGRGATGGAARHGGGDRSLHRIRAHGPVPGERHPVRARDRRGRRPALQARPLRSRERGGRRGRERRRAPGHLLHDAAPARTRCS